MENNDLKAIEDLVANQDEHIRKLHAIVEDAIKEEEYITDNLKNPPKEYISPGQKLSDNVAMFGGSWKFIIIFAVILFVWISYNTLVTKNAQFDPYPYILMNLVLSCIAALQAPIIMMSQNRQEEKDRQRAENDYLVNLKSEIEIRNLHQKVNLLMEEQLKQLIESQALQIQLLKELHKKVDKQQISQ